MWLAVRRKPYKESWHSKAEASVVKNAPAAK